DPAKDPAPSSDKDDQPIADCFGDPLPSGAIVRLGTVRLRRGSQAQSDLAFTPDGNALVSARSNHVVQFWDAKTGKPLHQLCQDKRFDNLAFSANGKVLATVGLKRITIWNAVGRKPLRELEVGETRKIA